jgi:ribosomal protein S18 acetylase RimI-like enzyme
MVAEGTQMFLGEELENFMSSMATHLSAAERSEDTPFILIVATESEEEASPIVGAAYFAPEVMAQGVMNLLFIGVLPDGRKKGVGQALLDHFEEVVRASGARLAIIETASDDMFAPAWSLYKKAGYDEEARVRDFYDDGLDKLVFRKRP